MEKSSVFARGQLWYWEDPIYGKKGDGEGIDIRESTMRYSRYVIVAQTTNTINKTSVLVIPCSSTSNCQNDVEVPIAHLFCDDVTCARIKYIFPAHPKSLQRYVCTIPDNIMKRIESELLKLFIPSIIDGISVEKLKEYFNLEIVETQVRENPTLHERTMKNHIRQFISKCLKNTDCVGDIISVQDIKEEFDKYCWVTNLPITENPVEFFRPLSEILSSMGICSIPRSDDIEHITGWRGLIFKERMEPLPLPEHSDVDQPGDTEEQVEEKKWTDKNILRFLREYQLYQKGIINIEAVCDEFDVKKPTVIKYWYLWRNRLDDIDETSNDTETNDSPNNISLPSTENVQFSISKLSNIIRDTMREASLFELVDDYQLDKGAVLGDELYSLVGICAYHSLLDFLNIRRVNESNLIIPKINTSTPNLNTWFFLDKIENDSRLSKEKKDGVKLMEAYRLYYHDINTGIGKGWLRYLEARLTKRLSMISTGIDLICGIIGEYFCEVV